jgi:hypothetical protein
LIFLGVPVPESVLDILLGGQENPQARGHSNLNPGKNDPFKAQLLLYVPLGLAFQNLNPGKNDPFKAQLLLYVPLGLAFQNRSFCSQTASMCCIRFWEQIISSLQATK